MRTQASSLLLSFIARLAFCLAAVIVFGTSMTAHAKRRILHKEMTHLRSGDRREWSSFPERANGSKLMIPFTAEPNTKPWTLGLRRVDVKEAWQVVLNGKRLGRLFSDENDMVEVWELAPGAIVAGVNRLVIEATGERGDDVRIGGVWIDDRPRAESLGESRITLIAKDSEGQPIPCRFTILNSAGSRSAIGAQSNDHLAIRPGVVYSSTGRAEIGLASGDYTVLCGRGFEYDLSRRAIKMETGSSTELMFRVNRVVETSGLAACDTHVHTFEVSRHGDASLAERMITLAGEGIELAVATDHNVHVDYRPYLKRYKVASYVTPIIGNEVTTKFGHFNVFPATATAEPSNHKAPSWEALFKSIYATPDVRFAIINHPRDVHSGFTPFDPENMIGATGTRLDNRTLQANGLELINSAALQSDPMVLFHDWLTIVNGGQAITAIGSSDSHEVARKIVGQGRSYVYVDDTKPGEIDVDDAVSSFIAGRVLVSLGLLVDMKVNGVRSGGTLKRKVGTDSDGPSKEAVEVEVRVQGPAWTTAERVDLFANGCLIRTREIPEQRRRIAGVKSTVKWRLGRMSHDIHLVAVARGPGVRGLHWPVAKPYQPSSTEWRPFVFGCTGVVRIDADGDGQWKSARELARDVMSKTDGKLKPLLAELRNYDPSVALFAAEQWSRAGGRIGGPEATGALAVEKLSTLDAFMKFARSEGESLRAQAER